MYSYGDYLRDLIARPLVFTNRYGVIKADDFMNSLVRKVRGSIILNSGGVDETKDFGGNIYQGGIEFDKTKLKKYILAVADDAGIYLRNPSGKINYNMDSILMCSNVLRNRGRFEDASKIMDAGMLYNSDYIAEMLNRITKIKKPTKIGFYIGTYSAKKYDYHQKYMMYLTVPQGYKCYLFEPENIVQIVILSRIAGMNSTQIQQYLNANRSGVLISEIDQHTEGVVYDTLLRNKTYKLDGYYGMAFKQANRQAVVANGESPESSSDTFFCKVLIHDFLKLMDRIFFIPFNNDLAMNPSVTEKDCFINFITPRSVSVCIREDLEVGYILPSLANKLKDVGTFNMLDPMNYV